MKIEVNELLTIYRGMFRARTKIYEEDKTSSRDANMYLLLATYSQLRGMIDFMWRVCFTDIEELRKYERELKEWYEKKRKELVTW